MSFNGRTSASQAENEGSQIRRERIWTAKRPEHSEGEGHGWPESIPFTRSKNKAPQRGALFLVTAAEVDTYRHAENTDADAYIRSYAQANDKKDLEKI